MIRIEEIQNAFRHLVGWQGSYNPNHQIKSSMSISESGLLYEQAHPLMTLENIWATMPEISDTYIDSFPLWEAQQSYNKGDIVRYSYTEGGVIYVRLYKSMIAGNTGNEPSASDFNNDFDESDFGGAWFPYSPYEAYLDDLYRRGIAKMVQAFLGNKKVRRENKALLESNVFFDGSASLGAHIPNSQSLVGFEIVPVRGMGVTVKLERIGLQFNGGTGRVRVYIFHSSRSLPYYTQDLYYSRTNGTFQWFNLNNVYLPYISADNNAGGAWYIVYDQRALPSQTMRALRINKDWSVPPCSGCNIGSVAQWSNMTKYMRVSPFKVPSEGFNGRLWDISTNKYTPISNYGMNLQYTVECDLTDTMIRNKQIFADVLQKQVTYEALRMMAMNPEVRVNRHQTNVSRNEILYELDGNPSGHVRSGLGYELKRAYDALEIDTRGLDKVCLPCHNNGVNYGAIR